ncbi:MAG: hypothetical protein Fues2KO_09830 [Fuerstiella sp.]
MDIRVTERMGTRFANDQLRRHAAELQRTQQEISSGLRLHRPSDDPAAMRRSIIQKDQLDRLETHVDSVNHVKARLNSAHVQLREAQQLMVKARGVALSISQATEPAEQRILASELDGILNQLISVANAQDENGFLFAGQATRTEPFAVARSAGAIQGVTYQGNSDTSGLHITGQETREALVAGNHIFQHRERDDTVILGSTGLSSGTGTDTGNGRATIEITHTSTWYAAGSNVGPGTSMASDDTIIGPLGANYLTIVDTSGTGAFGTISLNGGAEFAFTNTDTDLQVTGPSGEVVHLNTTAINPGFAGDIQLVGNGEMSLDGGQTTTPIAFGNNQSVINPQDGSTIYLDTTTLRQVGTAHVEFPGTSDVFQLLLSLKEDVLNERGLGNEDRFAAVERQLADLERLENHLLDEVGVQSVALEQMERLQTRTEDLVLEQKTKYGETTSADIADAAVRMQELLTLQQFTMASVSRVLSQNLLDFIQ